MWCSVHMSWGSIVSLINSVRAAWSCGLGQYLCVFPFQLVLSSYCRLLLAAFGAFRLYPGCPCPSRGFPLLRRFSLVLHCSRFVPLHSSLAWLCVFPCLPASAFAALPVPHVARLFLPSFLPFSCPVLFFFVMRLSLAFHFLSHCGCLCCTASVLLCFNRRFWLLTLLSWLSAAVVSRGVLRGSALVWALMVRRAVLLPCFAPGLLYRVVVFCSRWLVVECCSRVGFCPM